MAQGLFLLEPFYRPTTIFKLSTISGRKTVQGLEDDSYPDKQLRSEDPVGLQMKPWTRWACLCNRGRDQGTLPIDPHRYQD